MIFKIAFVSNGMLPKPALPKAAFTFALPSWNYFMHRYGAREVAFE